MRGIYYEPSGLFSALVWPVFILFQVISVPILSLIYIYLIYHIPFIYLNFIITIGCGIVAGGIMRSILILGKVRNKKLALFLGISASFLLKYVQWCIYIPIVLTKAYDLLDLSFTEQLQGSLMLFLDPLETIKYMYDINQIGVWGLFNLDFTGFLLLAVWIVEFAMITGTICMMSKEQSEYPFFEDNGTWYKEVREKVKMAIPQNFYYIKDEMERGDFKSLLYICKEFTPDNMNYLTLTFLKPKHIDGYDITYYLNIDEITITYDKKLKEKISKNSLLEYISIDKNFIDELYGVYE